MKMSRGLTELLSDELAAQVFLFAFNKKFITTGEVGWAIEKREWDKLNKLVEKGVLKYRKKAHPGDFISHEYMANPALLPELLRLAEVEGEYFFDRELAKKEREGGWWGKEKDVRLLATSTMPATTLDSSMAFNISESPDLDTSITIKFPYIEAKAEKVLAVIKRKSRKINKFAKSMQVKDPGHYLYLALCEALEGSKYEPTLQVISNFIIFWKIKSTLEKERFYPYVKDPRTGHTEKLSEAGFESVVRQMALQMSEVPIESIEKDLEKHRMKEIFKGKKSVPLTWFNEKNNSRKSKK